MSVYDIHIPRTGIVGKAARNFTRIVVESLDPVAWEFLQIPKECASLYSISIWWPNIIFYIRTEILASDDRPSKKLQGHVDFGSQNEYYRVTSSMLESSRTILAMGK